MSSIGDFIKSKRTELNMTMIELSDKIGTSQSALSFIENDRRVPNIETLRKLSFALKLTDDEFQYLINKRSQSAYDNRTLRNSIESDKLYNNYIHYKNQRHNLRIELFKGYITEFNIRTTKDSIDTDKFNSNINDILIKSFVENAILDLLFKNQHTLIDSIKHQFTEYINEVEELLNSVNSNTIFK